MNNINMNPMEDSNLLDLIFTHLDPDAVKNASLVSR